MFSIKTNEIEYIRIGRTELVPGVERLFFPESERNDQERSHRSEKKLTLRTRSERYWND